MTGATGQVEREARELVEAAARWLSAVPDNSAGSDNSAASDNSAGSDNTEYAARTVDLESDTEASVGSGGGGVSEEAPLGNEDAGRAQEQEGMAREHERDHDHERDQDHDQDRGHAEEHVCRGCPWCRAKAAAGPIGADTLDSIAHLLSSAAESLSLFAQSRREASHEPAPEATTAPPEADAGPDDAVIDWEDEDEDEFRAGEGEQPKQSPTKERRAR